MTSPASGPVERPLEPARAGDATAPSGPPSPWRRRLVTGAIYLLAPALLASFIFWTRPEEQAYRLRVENGLAALSPSDLAVRQRQIREDFTTYRQRANLSQFLLGAALASYLAATATSRIWLYRERRRQAGRPASGVEA